VSREQKTIAQSTRGRIDAGRWPSGVHGHIEE